MNDENLRECPRCGTYLPLENFTRGRYWCKDCWAKYTINLRFFKKLQNINPIKRDEIVFHYFKTLNQEDIIEQIQNMSDNDIKLILNNILKNKIPINQEYFKNRYKKKTTK